MVIKVSEILLWFISPNDKDQKSFLLLFFLGFPDDVIHFFCCPIEKVLQCRESVLCVSKVSVSFCVTVSHRVSLHITCSPVQKEKTFFDTLVFKKVFNIVPKCLLCSWFYDFIISSSNFCLSMPSIYSPFTVPQSRSLFLQSQD